MRLASLPLAQFPSAHSLSLAHCDVTSPLIGKIRVVRKHTFCCHFRWDFRVFPHYFTAQFVSHTVPEPCPRAQWPFIRRYRGPNSSYRIFPEFLQVRVENFPNPRSVRGGQFIACSILLRIALWLSWLCQPPALCLILFMCVRICWVFASAEKSGRSIAFDLQSCPPSRLVVVAPHLGLTVCIVCSSKNTFDVLSLFNFPNDL